MTLSTAHDYEKRPAGAVPAPGTSHPGAKSAPAHNPVWQRLATRPYALQPKLAVGAPGDTYEREADRVAERVTSTPAPLVQRACACGGTCPKCGGGTRQEEGVRVQTKHADGVATAQAVAPPAVHETLRSP